MEEYWKAGRQEDGNTDVQQEQRYAGGAQEHKHAGIQLRGYTGTQGSERGFIRTQGTGTHKYAEGMQLKGMEHLQAVRRAAPAAVAYAVILQRAMQRRRAMLDLAQRACDPM